MRPPSTIDLLNLTGSASIEKPCLLRDFCLISGNRVPVTPLAGLKLPPAAGTLQPPVLTAEFCFRIEGRGIEGVVTRKIPLAFETHAIGERMRHKRVTEPVGADCAERSRVGGSPRATSRGRRQKKRFTAF